MTLADLAESFGLSMDEIKELEALGLLHALMHDDGRAYRLQHRIRIDVLLKGKALGFSPSEMQTLLGAKPVLTAARAPVADRPAALLKMLQTNKFKLVE